MTSIITALTILLMQWTCLTTSASAATITLDAVDTGFVTLAGGSAKGDGTLVSGATYNYSVGRELHYDDGSLGIPPGSTPLAPMDRNNYFTFDLSSVGAEIESASLEVYAGVFESVDATETFVLVAPADPGAALTDIDALAAGNLVGSTEFNEPSDLLIGVAGALYGNIEGFSGLPLASAVISSADDSTTLSIPIDLPGIAYLNDFSGGPVVLGGVVSTVVLGGLPDFPQQPFGGTGPDIPGGDPLTPKLVLTIVPEPTTALLLASGLAGLAATALRRRRV
jgi:hypothetical protein